MSFGQKDRLSLRDVVGMAWCGLCVPGAPGRAWCILSAHKAQVMGLCWTPGDPEIPHPPRKSRRLRTEEILVASMSAYTTVPAEIT